MTERHYKPLSFVSNGELAKLKSLGTQLKNRICQIQPKASTKSTEKKKFRFDLDTFITQLLDSAIAGGLTFLVTLKDGGNIEYALIMFGITFLIRLKEYRKIE